MYTITRDQAAEILNISTRSIDRYIKSWKIRAIKEGKIVFIHSQDIDNLSWNVSQNQEIILPNQIPQKTQEVERNEDTLTIFWYLQEDLAKKDEEIKSLHKQIGQMEEVLKNSISLIEFKKNQFLLEDSKNALHSEVEVLKKEILLQKNFLKEEKKLTYILLWISSLLFLLLFVIWFVKI